MRAAGEGRAQLVEWLVERGATLNHSAKYGLTAVMLAALGGHVEAVRTLIAAGADLDRRGTGAPGFAGKTALELAIAGGHAEVAALLRA